MRANVLQRLINFCVRALNCSLDHFLSLQTYAMRQKSSNEENILVKILQKN